MLPRPSYAPGSNWESNGSLNEVSKGVAEVAARDAAAAATASADLKRASSMAPTEVSSLLVRLIKAVAKRFGIQITNTFYFREVEGAC